MNKQIERIKGKIEAVMISYKNEKILKGNPIDKNNFFDVAESNDFILVGSYSDLFRNYESKKESDEKIFDMIDNYLTNGTKPISVFIHGRLRQRSLVTFIMKEQPLGDLRDRFISCVFNSKNLMTHRDTISLLAKDGLTNIKNKNYAKECILMVIDNISKSKKDFGNVSSYFYAHDYKEIASILECFKFEKSDYKSIHNFFSFFKETINLNSDASTAYTRLLRNSIPYEDWSEFKKYSKNYSEKEKQAETLFEEIENPKYHLILSENFVLNKYPVLSLGGDYNIMLSVLMKQINDSKDSIGIKEGIYIGNEDKKSSLYFISKDSNPVNSELIKSIISCSIEIYAEACNNRKELQKDFWATTFQAIILANKLEKKELPQKKPMKI